MSDLDLTVAGLQPFHMPRTYLPVILNVAALVEMEAYELPLAGGVVRDIVLGNTIGDMDFVVGEKDVKHDFRAMLHRVSFNKKGLQLHPRKQTDPTGNVLRLWDDVSKTEIDLIYIKGNATLTRAAALANFGLSAIAANMSEICLDQRFVDDVAAGTNTMRDDIPAEMLEPTRDKMLKLQSGKLKAYALQPEWVFA